ncbi:MAG: VWA domain-containing protein, partial [Thermoanaerobaculia bacterium]
MSPASALGIDVERSDINAKDAGANAQPLAPIEPLTGHDQSNPPTFVTGTELVVVDFVVTDKTDRPVRGLSVKDFVVKEDGRERPIVSFAAFGGDDHVAATRGGGLESPAHTTPRSPDAATVIVVDDGQLSPEQTARLRPALKALLTTLSERSGSMMLVAPWSKVSVAGWLPTGAADLAAAVDRISGQRVDDRSNFPVDDAEALAIFRGDLPALARVAGRFRAINPELTADQANELARERANLLAHDARTRRDDMYGVALQSLDWLTNRPGRHSVIVVSAGIAQDPDDSKYIEVVTRSLRADAPIHFLDSRGLPGIGRYQGVENGVALNRNQDEG